MLVVSSSVEVKCRYPVKQRESNNNNNNNNNNNTLTPLAKCEPESI
jgi:hypothetical protein